MRDPEGYEEFWKQLAQSKSKLRPELPHNLSLSSKFSELNFPHTNRLNPHNRYRSLESDSLERTIHVLELFMDKSVFSPTKLFSVDNTLEQKLLENLNHLLCRVYDHGISLLELEIDLEDWLQSKSATEVAVFLDDLQIAGIELGEALAYWLNDNVLDPVFDWVKNTPKNSSDFIETGEANIDNGEWGSVLWVTRTLIFEEGDATNQEYIIRHWLKDSGGAEEVNGQSLMDQIIIDEKRHMTRWLNYLFREGAYQSLEIQSDIKSKCVRAFCDEWEAMVYAQYFYSALDIVDLHLTKILAYTLSDEPDIRIDRQKELLAKNIRNTNMLLIQLHDSSKYYKRTVKAKLDDILAYWDFEEVLVNPVQRKIDLCRERLTILHQQEAAKSAVYTDMILLGIGVTSIFGTFIALAEYGRNMANDVNLASYDVNSTNIVDWFARQPTDVILVVSSVLSLLLVVLYFYYRQLQAS